MPDAGLVPMVVVEVKECTCEEHNPATNWGRDDVTQLLGPRLLEGILGPEACFIEIHRLSQSRSRAGDLTCVMVVGQNRHVVRSLPRQG
jgi:hypothetical protein